MVLLDILSCLQPKHGYLLKAIHINHGVRDHESDRDEDFVKKHCRERGFELITHGIEGLSAGSSEDQLRKARYAAFDNLVEDAPRHKIALGHHFNDQLETFLMRLATGASLRGLAGMPYRRGKYIRPLLVLTRREIRRYVDERNLPWIEDRTNRNIDKLRNYLRWNVIPSLEEAFGPRFYKGFQKSLGEIGQSSELMQTYAADLFNRLVRRKDHGLYLNTGDFNQLLPMEQHLLIEYCISFFYPLNYTFSKKQVNAVIHFIQEAETGSKFEYKEITLRKQRNELVWKPEFPLDHLRAKELYPETYIPTLGNIISVHKVAYEQIRYERSPNVEFICGDHLSWPLKIRTWQEGDYFYPVGMGGKQKLSDFFINQKIELEDKIQIPLVLNGNDIVWVVGHRLDERYKITEACSMYYKLEYRKE